MGYSVTEINGLLLAHHADYDGKRLTMYTICDGTFLFLWEMLEILRVLYATNIHYQTEHVESPDDNKPWLTCKFSVSGEIPEGILHKINENQHGESET